MPPKGVIDPAVAGIAHAKDAKGVIFDFGFLIFSRIPGTRSRAVTCRLLTQRSQRSEGEYRGGGMSGYRV